MADETLKFVWIKMANNKHTHPDFDQAAIDSYLNGRMSPEAVRQFELAMLDDPFLADAVEGFKQADAATTNHHLATLAALISGEAENEKKAAVIPINRNYWWRVAAGIIVIAGAGIITYKVMQPAVPTIDVAQVPTVTPPAQVDTANKQEEQPNTTTAIMPKKEDVKSLADNTNRQSAIEKPITTPQQQMAAIEGNKEKSQVAAVEDVTKVETESVKNVTTDATRGRSNDVKVANNNNDFFQHNNATNRPIITSGPTEPDTRNYRGRVTRANGEPVAAAIVKTNNNTAAITDEEGNFDIKAKGDSTLLTVEGIGIAKADVIAKQNATNNIVVKDADLSLSEVVVVGYGNQKKKDIAASTQKNMVAKRGAATAMPIGGMAAFNQYATTAFKALIDTAAYPSATVELAFILNKKGIPSKIKVVQSTHTTLNSAAIQVLKNGPKWQGATNQKVNITIAAH
jgi:hypothetical protein